MGLCAVLAQSQNAVLALKYQGRAGSRKAAKIRTAKRASRNEISGEKS